MGGKVNFMPDLVPSFSSWFRTIYRYRFRSVLPRFLQFFFQILAVFYPIGCFPFRMVPDLVSFIFLPNLVHTCNSFFKVRMRSQISPLLSTAGHAVPITVLVS